ncbi:ABC transporter substrate-binding protein [Microbacterium sp. A588]
MSVSVVAILLTGCAGDSGSPRASTAGATDSPITWGVSWASGYTTLTPEESFTKTPTAQSGVWLNLIYGSMLKLTPDGLAPGLASGWEIIDAKTVELTIRSGVTFHDGTPFTAEAVKVAWDKIINEYAALIGNPVIKSMESVEIIGDEKIRVSLNAPKIEAFTYQMLTSALRLGVPSPTAVEELGASFAESPVGAGPYSFVSSVPLQEVRLEKYDDGWEADDYHPSAVTFKLVDSGTATSIALRSGEIDGGWISSFGEIESLKAAGVDIVAQSSLMSPLVSMCATSGPLSDVRARLAVAKAFDQEAVNHAVLGGLGEERYFLLPPGVGTSEQAAEKLSYDLDEAKALVKEAGVVGAELEIVADQEWELSTAVATVLQSQLESIGFNAKVTNQNNGRVWAKENQSDLYITNVGAFSMDAPIGPNAALNQCGNSFPAVEDALVAANATAGQSQDVVDAAWVEFQDALATDVPALYFVGVPNVLGTASTVRGVEFIYPEGTQNAFDWRGVYKSN